MVCPSGAKLVLVPVYWQETSILCISSCRVPITSSHKGIGIRFLVAKRLLRKFSCLKIWVYLSHLAFYLESFQQKHRKRTFHHASGLKHLQHSFSPLISTFLCCFKFKLSKASEHTVKLLLKRFCLPCVSQTLYSISDSFHVGVFAKLFGSPSLWLTSPLSPCYFYPPCQG